MPDTIVETPYRWSRDAYDRAVCASVFDPDDRLELIDGQLLAMNPQGSRHAAIIASCICVSDRRCISFAHVLNAAASIDSTL